jgi:hypothetical protein
MLPGGHRVDWLAAGTFDRAVGFSLFTLQVTHKIDANTDIERDHIVATLRAAVPETRVVLIRDFSTGYHSRNGGGDSIQTDGDLPVIDLRRVTVSHGAVENERQGAAEGAEDAEDTPGDTPGVAAGGTAELTAGPVVIEVRGVS